MDIYFKFKTLYSNSLLQESSLILYFLKHCLMNSTNKQCRKGGISNGQEPKGSTKHAN